MSEKIYYVLHANSNFWHDKYGDILGIYNNLDYLRHDAYQLISNVLKDYPLSRISDNKISADSGLAITGGPINTNPQDSLRFSPITVRVNPHVDAINFDIEDENNNDHINLPAHKAKFPDPGCDPKSDHCHGIHWDQPYNRP